MRTMAPNERTPVCGAMHGATIAKQGQCRLSDLDHETRTVAGTKSEVKDDAMVPSITT